MILGAMIGNTTRAQSARWYGEYVQFRWLHAAQRIGRGASASEARMGSVVSEATKGANCASKPGQRAK